MAAAAPMPAAADEVTFAVPAVHLTSLCENAAARAAAGGWVCVDDVVYTYVYAPEQPVDPDLSGIHPTADQSLDEAEAQREAIDVQQENLEHSLDGLTQLRPAEPGPTCDDYCNRKITNFYWRIDATVQYGIGYGPGQGEIGRIRVVMKTQVNGRSATSTWQSDPIYGPATKDTVSIRCEDTNGWRPSTSCGHTNNYSSWHTAVWYADLSTYHRDNSDYRFHWLYAFHAQGRPNPDSSSGAFYVAPFTTGTMKCRSGYSGGKCQFRD